MTFDEAIYYLVSLVAVMNVLGGIVVIYRVDFCSPPTIVLTVIVVGLNLGMLQLGIQRAAEHSNLTIGLATIVTFQIIGIWGLWWVWRDRTRRP